MENKSNGLPLEMYKDVAQPAVREVGEAVGRAVRLALAPAHGAIWTLEQAEDYVTARLKKIFTQEEAATLIPPPARILGPVLAGIAQVGDEQLRSLYAQLLATSMKPEEQSSAHPAFAEVIRQLTPSEARILNVVASMRKIPTLHVMLKQDGETKGVWVRHVATIGLEAGVDFPSKTNLYLDNLARLRLIQELEPLSKWDEDSYRMVYQLDDIESIRRHARLRHSEIVLHETGFSLSDFGSSFAEVCLKGFCIPYDASGRLTERVVGYLKQLERANGKL